MGVFQQPAVISMNPILDWGIDFIAGLQTSAPWLEAPSRFFSFLGTEKFYLFLLPFLYWCVDVRLGLRVGVILTLSDCLNTFFKFLFHQPRPYWLSDKVRVIQAEVFIRPSVRPCSTRRDGLGNSGSAGKGLVTLADGGPHLSHRLFAHPPGCSLSNGCAGRLVDRRRDPVGVPEMGIGRDLLVQSLHTVSENRPGLCCLDLADHHLPGRDWPSCPLLTRLNGKPMSHAPFRLRWTKQPSVCAPHQAQSASRGLFLVWLPELS